MSNLREAALQALDAIAEAHDESLNENHFECRQILMAQIKSLRAALAQPDDKAQPVAWQPLETAPEGVRVLLGPRNAPVVGVVKHMPDWADEQDSIAHVVHYNGKTLVSNYRCSEWMSLPDAAPQPPAERQCTCHPDDSPPRPCAGQYAVTECKKVAEHGTELSDGQIPSIAPDNAVDKHLNSPGVLDKLARRHPAALVRGMARALIAADRAARGGDK